MKHAHCLAVVLAPAIIAGCSRELTQADAARIVGEHLTALSPSVLLDVEREILIRTIVTPDEFNRDVRFQMIHRGAQGVDTTDVVTARFQQSDRGWTIAEYSEPLLEYVAALLIEERATAYADLLEAFAQVDSAYAAWRDDLSDRQDAALAGQNYRRFGRLVDLERLGPDRPELQRWLDSLGLALPASAVWAVERSDLPSQLPVLWVAKADSLEIRCAQLMSYATGGPAGVDFYWLEDTYLTCQGRAKPFSYGLFEDVQAEIREAGSVHVP